MASRGFGLLTFGIRAGVAVHSEVVGYIVVQDLIEWTVTLKEAKLADYLIAYGKATNAVKAIEEAAAHIGVSYDEARKMVNSLELREELFLGTDPARNTLEGEPARTPTRCWWQRKKPEGAARLQ
jgi:hypothetical protein